jgi:replication-associated recombination protein RarA
MKELGYGGGYRYAHDEPALLRRATLSAGRMPERRYMSRCRADLRSASAKRWRLRERNQSVGSRTPAEGQK